MTGSENLPVVVTLQGDDIFLRDLPEPQRSEALAELNERVAIETQERDVARGGLAHVNRDARAHVQDDRAQVVVVAHAAEHQIAALRRFARWFAATEPAPAEPGTYRNVSGATARLANPHCS
mgnify:CR=1 FL=1